MEDIGPAGSLQPIAERKDWTKGIDGAGLSELQALAKDIDKTIDQTVKHVARGKIKVGKLLLEARAYFIDDQSFGKWRKENTMVQSKQHAHYLMKVAERFGDAPKLIDGVNYSVLQELLLAEQKDIEWIEQKIDKGEPIPPVVEVREQVKQTKGTSKKALLGNGKKSTPPVLITPNASINELVGRPLTLRIMGVIDRKIQHPEGDLIILGLDPDPQCPCNPLVLDAIHDLWQEQAQNKNENRAVTDSYNRIKQYFEDWDSQN